VAYLLKMGVANLFKGYRAVIRVIGVGYKLELIKSNHLQISLGFSHKIKLKIPYYIKIHIFKKKTIV
jgi:ribosomal protein L6P/L9E